MAEKLGEKEIQEKSEEEKYGIDLREQNIIKILKLIFNQFDETSSDNFIKIFFETNSDCS